MKHPVCALNGCIYLLLHFQRRDGEISVANDDVRPVVGLMLTGDANAKNCWIAKSLTDAICIIPDQKYRFMSAGISDYGRAN